MNVNPSQMCMHKLIKPGMTFMDVRQGLNDCCYSVCDQFNNPFGDNSVFNECNRNCKQFSNDMIKAMGKDPIDYQHLFVRPPTHLRIINNYDSFDSCVQDCKGPQCKEMCKEIKKSIVKEDMTSVQDFKKNHSTVYNILFYTVLIISIIYAFYFLRFMTGK